MNIGARVCALIFYSGGIMGLFSGLIILYNRSYPLPNFFCSVLKREGGKGKMARGKEEGKREGESGSTPVTPGRS